MRPGPLLRGGERALGRARFPCSRLQSAALEECTNFDRGAGSLLNPGSISILGWAFTIFVTLVVPWAVMRNRDSAVAMAGVPLATRFYAMLMPQVVLGGLAVVTGFVEGVELFPRRAPTISAWLAGAVFLAVSITLVRPYWRRSIEEQKPTWRLFAPTNRTETRMWVALSLSAGMGEELVWRGVLPALLTSFTGSLPVALTLCVLSFALAHAVQGVRSVFAIAGIAASFHALVAWSGSLYVAMAVHFTYDVIAGVTYARFARELGFLPPLRAVGEGPDKA